MNSEDPLSINMRRLRVLTHGLPLIHDDNWQDLSTLGWHWWKNLKLDNYALAVETIKKLQVESGRESVAIGHAFNRDLHQPSADAALVGIYIKDITKLVFSLYRDMAKWEFLTAKDIEEL